MLSVNDLKYIFYSDGNERRADNAILTDIAYLIEINMLFYSKITLCSKNKYSFYIDQLKEGKLSQYDIAGGGIGHMVLKLIAMDVLRQNREDDSPIVEQEFEGYRPDIMTRNRQTIIECGTINPQKLLAYFKSSIIRKLIIIPYPSEEDNSILGHTFTPGEELLDFILFLEKDRLDKLRQITGK